MCTICEEEKCKLDRNNWKKCLTAAVTEKRHECPPDINYHLSWRVEAHVFAPGSKQFSQTEVKNVLLEVLRLLSISKYDYGNVCEEWYAWEMLGMCTTTIKPVQRLDAPRGACASRGRERRRSKFVITTPKLSNHWKNVFIDARIENTRRSVRENLWTDLHWTF